MRSYWTKRGNAPSPWTLILIGAALLAALAGCKKEDVVAAAAEQAAEEAAQQPILSDEADITAVGLSVYPGARLVPKSELTLEMVTSSVYGHSATYTVRAPFDQVVAWYRQQMEEPLVSFVSTDNGRSASLREDSTNQEEAATRFVLVSETADGVEIRLTSDARPARFAVYLDSVSMERSESVISAIVDWRQRTTEDGDEWTEAQVLTAKEEARKLLPVLPRPVDVGLGYEETVELLGLLEAAGGEVHSVPPTDRSADYRGPRTSAASLFASEPVEPEADQASESSAAESSPVEPADGAPSAEENAPVGD